MLHISGLTESSGFWSVLMLQHFWLHSTLLYWMLRYKSVDLQCSLRGFAFNASNSIMCLLSNRQFSTSMPQYCNKFKVPQGRWKGATGVDTEGMIANVQCPQTNLCIDWWWKRLLSLPGLLYTALQCLLVGEIDCDIPRIPIFLNQQWSEWHLLVSLSLWLIHFTFHHMA